MRGYLTSRWVQAGVGCLLLLASACGPKRAPAPPTPPANQNVFALLTEPGGESTGIVVRNQAGAQELSQPNQAVRVDRNNAPPSAPYQLSDADVKRLFGAAIDVLPAPEIQFVLHFDEGRDALNTDSQAMIPAILDAIRQRHSTSISVTGHTDTVDTPQFNYNLGLRRANGVATILLSQGVKASDLFISSHGDADLLVKTARGVAELRNRRVEVIVR
jgi:outer membrane protein OmpA-like peptidoglycan-associated protein